MNTISLTRRRALIAAILVCSILAQACDKDKIHQAAKAADREQTLIDAAIDTTTQLFHDGVLTKEKAHEVTLIIQKVQNANGALINLVAGMSADTPVNRCLVAKQLQVVINAVDELRQSGVWGVKSKEGVMVFNTLITSLRTSIDLIVTTLGDCGQSVNRSWKVVE